MYACMYVCMYVCMQCMYECMYIHVNTPELQLQHSAFSGALFLYQGRP